MPPKKDPKVSQETTKPKPEKKTRTKSKGKT